MRRAWKIVTNDKRSIRGRTWGNINGNEQADDEPLKETERGDRRGWGHTSPSPLSLLSPDPHHDSLHLKTTVPGFSVKDSASSTASLGVLLLSTPGPQLHCSPHQCTSPWLAGTCPLKHTGGIQLTTAEWMETWRFPA